MKKMFGVFSILCIFTMFMTPVMAEGVYGIIYKNATEPGSGSSNVAPIKKGTATCTSFLALVGVGQCGIKDAMKNGNIRSLSFYDTKTRNILGYKKVTVNAYGQ